MLNHLTKRLVVGGLLAVVTTFAMVDTADALTRRLRFDPDYGAPFPTLGWKGYADVSYDTCDGPGWVSNLPSSCNGALTFLGATVQLYESPTSNVVLETLTFSGGQVALMNFDSSSQLTQVISTPFNPVQSSISQAQYNGSDQAWFSLIFVGEYAQLMWFESDPGAPAVTIPPLPFGINLPIASTYLSCYLFGQNGVWGEKRDDCGISSNLDSKGAAFEVTAVPEPETYALMIAGLAAVGFMARRRRSLR